MNLEQIRSSLETDDNKALNHIYISYGTYCIENLMKYKGCMKEDAEDLFIEAVMIFREKVLSGKIQKLTSTRNYLYSTCKNMYLAKLKVERAKEKKMSDLEMFFYSSPFVTEADNWESDLSQAVKSAFDGLSEKCKDIISYFYINRLRMDAIADLMGLANADVAKTTKARCFKTMFTSAHNFYKLNAGNV